MTNICFSWLRRLGSPISRFWHIWGLVKLCLLVHQSVSSIAQTYPTPCNPMDCSRPPCPSATRGACSNSCPSSWWCHSTISSSVDPFSSCLQSLPASGSFPMSQLFTSGGQSIGFNFSISPSNEYSGLFSFRMDWLDLLAFQRTLKYLLQHHSSNAWVIQCSTTFMV